MVAVNRVLIAGNLTRDPQTKFIAGDRAVCNFGVAINSKWKAADGTTKEDVTFVEVEAWGRTAELCGQYLVKGRPVFVEGRLTQSTYEDKNGNKVSKTRVRADAVQFLGAPRHGDEDRAVAATAATAATATPNPPPASKTDDEPPF